MLTIRRTETGPEGSARGHPGKAERGPRGKGLCRPALAALGSPCEVVDPRGLMGPEGAFNDDCHPDDPSQIFGLQRGVVGLPLEVQGRAERHFPLQLKR